MIKICPVKASICEQPTTSLGDHMWAPGPCTDVEDMLCDEACYGPIPEPRILFGISLGFRQLCPYPEDYVD